MRKGSKIVIVEKLTVFASTPLALVDLELIDGNEAIYHTTWQMNTMLKNFADEFLGLYDFWEHHGHRTVPLRAPCVCLNLCHKNYGCRRDALRRPCVITSKDVGQPQFFFLHKLKMHSTAAVANVTARVCSRRNTAAAVEFLLTVEM